MLYASTGKFNYAIYFLLTELTLKQCNHLAQSFLHPLLLWSIIYESC